MRDKLNLLIVLTLYQTDSQISIVGF